MAKLWILWKQSNSHLGLLYSSPYYCIYFCTSILTSLFKFPNLFILHLISLIQQVPVRMVYYFLSSQTQEDILGISISKHLPVESQTLLLDFSTFFKAYFTWSRSTFLSASTHHNFYKSYGFLQHLFIIIFHVIFLYAINHLITCIYYFFLPHSIKINKESSLLKRTWGCPAGLVRRAVDSWSQWYMFKSHVGIEITLIKTFLESMNWDLCV